MHEKTKEANILSKWNNTAQLNINFQPPFSPLTVIWFCNICFSSSTLPSPEHAGPQNISVLAEDLLLKSVANISGPTLPKVRLDRKEDQRRTKNMISDEIEEPNTVDVIIIYNSKKDCFVSSTNSTKGMFISIDSDVNYSIWLLRNLKTLLKLLWRSS